MTEEKLKQLSNYTPGTWNNRILRHKAPWGEYYAIHEVHYDPKHKPLGWTVDGQKPYGETVGELIESLKMMISGAEKSKDDIIDHDSKPEGDPLTPELEKWISENPEREDASAEKVWFDDDSMWLKLTDGRTLGIPIEWFPRLLNAASEQREKFEISGHGIHWEDLDEDICLCGLLAGEKDSTRHIPNAETVKTLLEERHSR